MTASLPRLRPLWSSPHITIRRWEADVRPKLEAEWRALMGHPAFSPSEFESQAELIRESETGDFVARFYRQSTGPDHFQKVIVLHPHRPASDPAPCAVVPFYQPETVAGLAPLNPNEELRGAGCPLLQFGRHLARKGFVVACVEAFAYNTLPEGFTSEGVALEKSGGANSRWPVAARELARRHPEWTGMGKLVHDTSLALDLLLEQPGVDPERVLIMGHSLGGKMAFYTGALDPRFRCVIASDFGLPWRSTNWDSPWYLGSRVPKDDTGPAHHELLALLAPRPFYLIAGETDTEESWRYLDAARPAYALYGSENHLDGMNHASGHRPTEDSITKAYLWLDRMFDLPPREWSD